MKKLITIKNENNMKMQKYMTDKSLEDSRLEFKWRTNMLDTRTTMKGKYKPGQTCMVPPLPGGLGGVRGGDAQPPAGLRGLCRLQGRTRPRARQRRQGQIPKAGYQTKRGARNNPEELETTELELGRRPYRTHRWSAFGDEESK